MPFYRDRSHNNVEPLALRLREAAAALSVSPKTVERLTMSGELPSVKLGRVRLYEISTLEKFLASRRVAGQEVAS
jgi:excisionase family DNA binding protein